LGVISSLGVKASISIDNILNITIQINVISLSELSDVDKISKIKELVAGIDKSAKYCQKICNL
jgi:hypothetical protein